MRVVRPRLRHARERVAGNAHAPRREEQALDHLAGFQQRVALRLVPTAVLIIIVVVLVVFLYGGHRGAGFRAAFLPRRPPLRKRRADGGFDARVRVRHATEQPRREPHRALVRVGERRDRFLHRQVRAREERGLQLPLNLRHAVGEHLHDAQRVARLHDRFERAAVLAGALDERTRVRVLDQAVVRFERVLPPQAARALVRRHREFVVGVGAERLQEQVACRRVVVVPELLRGGRAEPGQPPAVTLNRDARANDIPTARRVEVAQADERALRGAALPLRVLLQQAEHGVRLRRLLQMADRFRRGLLERVAVLGGEREQLVHRPRVAEFAQRLHRANAVTRVFQVLDARQENLHALDAQAARQAFGREELRHRVLVLYRLQQRIGRRAALAEPPAVSRDRGVAELHIRAGAERCEHRVNVFAERPPRRFEQRPDDVVRLADRKRAVHQASEDRVVPRVLILHPRGAVLWVLVLAVADVLVVPADGEDRGVERVLPLLHPVEQEEQPVGGLRHAEPARRVEQRFDLRGAGRVVLDAVEERVGRARVTEARERLDDRALAARLVSLAEKLHECVVCGRVLLAGQLERGLLARLPVARFERAAKVLLRVGRRLVLRREPLDRLQAHRLVNGFERLLRGRNLPLSVAEQLRRFDGEIVRAGQHHALENRFAFFRARAVGE